MEIETRKNFSSGFVQEIKSIISNAQQKAVRAIDFARVMMYWKIGQKIFVQEQNERERAEYGAFLIKHLSAELSKDFGSGFSVRQLEMSRQFYKAFPIAHEVRAQLNWTQYKQLIRIVDEDRRTYYIEEACKNNWSARQLEQVERVQK